MGRGRIPRTKRIEESSTGGIDLDALESFCVSARANGAPGSVTVRGRVTPRGFLRSLRIDFVAEVISVGDHDPRA